MILLLVFGSIFLSGNGFYYGDYREQFYPWAFTLHQHLKNFSLPLWVPGIGCGFPLLAEGQVGALHPLQAALFMLLPFPAAYHAGFILYFAIAGAGTYFLARQMRLSVEASMVAAVVFLFSSPYAGMAYGLASLRTLCALPWCLYAAGRLAFSRNKSKDSVIFGVALGLFFLGGYWPWAPYLALATGGYFFYQRRQEGSSCKDPWLFFGLAWLLALGLAAAQLFPTLELIRFSARSETPLEFALQKSLNPLALVTYLWPSFAVFLGLDLYIGALPFGLAILALRGFQSDARVRFLAAAWLIFFLLALGKHNPAVVGALKLVPFYGLRAPSKAMIFANFALALMAGLGWDSWMHGLTQKKIRFPRVISAVVLSALVVWAATFIAARAWAGSLSQWAEDYVRNHVAGRFGHPYSLETYLARIPGFLQMLGDRTALQDRFVQSGLFFWAASGLFFAVSARIPLKKNFVFFGAFALILLDLGLYTDLGSGFKGNAVRPIEPDEVVERVTEEKGLFRTLEFRPEALAATTPWTPNVNLLFNYSTAGIYSPLVLHAYREALRPLGSVDNATGVIPTDAPQWTRSRELLDFLNVRFVLAGGGDPLTGVPRLKKIPVDVDGQTLYENLSAQGRALTGDPAAMDNLKEASVVHYDSRKILVEAQAQSDGERLILSDVWYPGWRAFVDGARAPVEKVFGSFRAVRLSEGRHRVLFEYRPTAFYIGSALSLLTLAVCAVVWLKGPA